MYWTFVTVMVCLSNSLSLFYSFCVNDTATTEIYTYRQSLSLHDALPIFLATQLEPTPRSAVTEKGDQLSCDPLVGARHAGSGRIVIATRDHVATIAAKRYKCNLTGRLHRASLGLKRRAEPCATRAVGADGRSDDQSGPRCGHPLRAAPARHAAAGCRRGLLP